MSDLDATAPAVPIVRPLLLPRGTDAGSISDTSGDAVTIKTTTAELAIAQANQMARWAATGHRLSYEDVEALLMLQIAIINRMSSKDRVDIERLRMARETFKLLIETVNSRHTLRGANPEVGEHVERLADLIEKLVGE